MDGFNMPDDVDRFEWYESYGPVSLEGFRWHLIAFMNGALIAGAYTIYYLGVQNYLDGKDQMLDVTISVAIALAADVFGALLFLFMIFGCICGCCKKDDDDYKAPTAQDYGAGNLAV